MEAFFKLCLLCLFLTLLSSPSDACCVNTCKKIKEKNPQAASGEYTVITSTRKTPIKVYCEMGLNGGGYTFLSPKSLTQLTSKDLAQMFTERSTFLMRVLRTDGTQPYSVLRQLTRYSSIPLKLGLSEYNGYNAPVNLNILGLPFLYFGFLPILNASNNNIQGLEINGHQIVFVNCDRNPNSQITIFPNFSEKNPSPYIVLGPVFGIFSLALPNPSGRMLPREYFMFAESHWGGCGAYVQTNQVLGVLGVSIGFK